MSWRDDHRSRRWPGRSLPRRGRGRLAEQDRPQADEQGTELTRVVAAATGPAQGRRSEGEVDGQEHPGGGQPGQVGPVQRGPRLPRRTGPARLPRPGSARRPWPAPAGRPPRIRMGEVEMASTHHHPQEDAVPRRDPPGPASGNRSRTAATNRLAAARSAAVAAGAWPSWAARRRRPGAAARQDLLPDALARRSPAASSTLEERCRPQVAPGPAGVQHLVGEGSADRSAQLGGGPLVQPGSGRLKANTSIGSRPATATPARRQTANWAAGQVGGGRAGRGCVWGDGPVAWPCSSTCGRLAAAATRAVTRLVCARPVLGRSGWGMVEAGRDTRSARRTRGRATPSEVRRRCARPTSPNAPDSCR